MDPQLNAAVNALGIGRNALEDALAYSLAQALAARGASKGAGSQHWKGQRRGRASTGEGSKKGRYPIFVPQWVNLDGSIFDGQ